MHMAGSHLVALAIASAACVFDLRTRRIPNWLTFGAAAAGMVFHLTTGGMSGFERSAGGWLIGAALLIAPYALGGMGGDVKLVGARGMARTWRHVLAGDLHRNRRGNRRHRRQRVARIPAAGHEQRGCCSCTGA
jgi:Flp pilus assembly protein protease CpaA